MSKRNVETRHNMELPKYHYIAWVMAALWLAFASGTWVSERISKDIAAKDLETINAAYEKAMTEPEGNVNDFFELLESEKYSRHADANVMGLILADAYSQERSGVVYVRAMHVMNEANIRRFLIQTYERLMENDRAEYEEFEFPFPDKVQDKIKSMFTNRPVFLFTPRENMAIMDCMDRVYQGIEISSWSLKGLFGYDEENGCKVLMKIHNNDHL